MITRLQIMLGSGKGLAPLISRCVSGHFWRLCLDLVSAHIVSSLDYISSANRLFQDCSTKTMIESVNGKQFPALRAVSMTLQFFKDHALRQLTTQSGTTITNDDVRWVVTVPAIWNAAAKQFMRQAGYQVRCGS